MTTPDGLTPDGRMPDGGSVRRHDPETGTQKPTDAGRLGDTGWCPGVQRQVLANEQELRFTDAGRGASLREYGDRPPWRGRLRACGEYCEPERGQDG